METVDQYTDEEVRAYRRSCVSIEKILERVCWDETPAESRDDFAAALRYLASVFGDEFIADACEQGHPFRQIVLGAPWTRIWFIRLARDIKRLTRLPGHEQLLRDLRSADHASPAMLHLYQVTRALDHGLEAELEPRTVRGKQADLALWLPDDPLRKLYVEVSQMVLLPRPYRDADALFEYAFPDSLLWANGLTGGGRLLRMVDDGEMERFRSLVGSFYQQRLEQKDAGSLLIDGVLEVWVAPRGDDQAETKFVSMGFPPGGSYSGAPVGNDEFQRLKVRVDDKIKQLSAHHPGVIIVEPFWEFCEPGDDAVQWALRHLSSQSPHVIALATCEMKDRSQISDGVTQLAADAFVAVQPHPEMDFKAEKLTVVFNRQRQTTGLDSLVDRFLTGRRD